jgi:hypothetical protein
MKSYIQYRIALCLHLEIYLVTSMIIIDETIRAELIVFIALFADLATVAVAYDVCSPPANMNTTDLIHRTPTPKNVQLNGSYPKFGSSPSS